MNAYESIHESFNKRSCNSCSYCFGKLALRAYRLKTYLPTPAPTLTVTCVYSIISQTVTWRTRFWTYYNGLCGVDTVHLIPKAI